MFVFQPIKLGRAAKWCGISATSRSKDQLENRRMESISNDQARHSRQQLCVHDLIAVQAEATPDAIALVAGGKSFTYSELNASANQLAHFLRAKGVGPEI